MTYRYTRHANERERIKEMLFGHLKAEEFKTRRQVICRRNTRSVAWFLYYQSKNAPPKG